MDKILSYQCPNCQAPLSYTPAKQGFACEYCLSFFEEEVLRAMQGLFTDEETTQAEETETQEEVVSDATSQASEDDFSQLEEYACPNCGAEVACTGNTAATICCYCHTPVIHKGKLSGQLAPHKIVPFQFDRKAAEERFYQFVRKKKFVPNDFFAPEQLEKMQGIYYPFWLTDADTKSDLSARATRVRSWTSGNYRYTETTYFRVQRGGDIHFEDIATSAMSDGDKEMLEGILPFPSEALQPFSMPFLSGFLTKKRDIEKEQLEGEVQRKMEGYATQILRNTITGYHQVTVEDVDVTPTRVGWEYGLFPVWLMVFKGKKRNYIYAMNGHTGKIYGELPVSWKKLLILAGSLFAAVGTIAAIIGGQVL